MIVKYFDNGVWGYIDNVRQAANKDIDCDELIRRYNEENTFEKPEDDIASYMNGEKLPVEIVMSNKAFTMACADVNDVIHGSQYGNSHTENLIDGSKIDYPASIVLLYLNDHKEYDTVALVTNQKCFLMNDKGQTIERLV